MRWSRGLFSLARFIVDGQPVLIIFATLGIGHWQCDLGDIPRTWEVVGLLPVLNVFF